MYDAGESQTWSINPLDMLTLLDPSYPHVCLFIRQIMSRQSIRSTKHVETDAMRLSSQ